MGKKLVNPILKAIDYDVVHTVFSFIPNTAEVAFYGMLEGFDNYLNELKVQRIEALGHKPSHTELEQILSQRIRSEKLQSRISNCVLSLLKEIHVMTLLHMCTI